MKSEQIKRFKKLRRNIFNDFRAKVYAPKKGKGAKYSRQQFKDFGRDF